jgi:hypothetical protein
MGNQAEWKLVRVSPSNEKKFDQIIEETKRTFAVEINLALEQYVLLNGHRFQKPKKKGIK